ncbi:PAS domain-containing protein [Pseudoduganella sp. DS3]|uniref:protein-glutamate O-methyltransferase n=1 Tax=Pseudoduganella guangdongensis TaxID=2692179 RepID=A0A6N9HH91_9BURK|nr:chemotaxis protein CheB [Pseudoduganella guangdongensis]MYN02991.1 PAS domain-containing protein [Pseudoduganella guangdongensis]
MTNPLVSPGSEPGEAQRQRQAVQIVGIGASAGGLDAISEFLASMPSRSGMAFIVMQHQDPSRRGLLPELLRRITSMEVCEIAESIELRPDHVYVAPPNCDLAFGSGKLMPVEMAEVHGRYPIDTFFRNLAAEKGQAAAGVVFSGMGTDGTAGLRAIQEAGGVTLAQEPHSAKFDSMPRSAISAGVADFVAAPVAMPMWLCQVRSAPHVGAHGAARARRQALRELMTLLQRHTGNNFTEYKMSTVLRRIERRMKLHQHVSMEEYVAYLRDNAGEVQLLFHEMLIGVTSFFRDPSVWEHLRNDTIPALLAANPHGAAFKAWVPACSTGEEAYTLAMVFDEAVQAAAESGRYSLQIFATDLHGDAIDKARLGLFGRGVEEAISHERLARYFTTDGVSYRIRKELRNMIIFAQQNIISDPPFTKLDILSCRNLLIYFNPKLQEQLIPLFHYALKPDGLLVLGSADTPGSYNELFAPVPGCGRIYRRLDASTQRVANYFPTKIAKAAQPSSTEVTTMTMNGNIQTQIEHLLLKSHTPAAVMINSDGDILYIHGRTGTFLEPAAGRANWNIHAMARDGLRYELADLIERANRSEGMEAVRELLIKDGAQSLLVDMTAEVVREDTHAGHSLLVTFQAAPVPARKRASRSDTRPQELEQQLTVARLELQSVREEMQTSREELKAANEELQSTNEELQSTNEELTTSKEEMQSLNEELYTVNAELQSKVDDLSLVNSDMKNLLNSTDIAVIFLDSQMNIRRYTNQATQLYKLIATDLNRPLSDIANDLVYPAMEDDAREVLRSLVFCERQIPTRDGRWFMVRIMPYRTVNNVIDGLVLTFVNVTELKLLEARLTPDGGNTP